MENKGRKTSFIFTKHVRDNLAKMQAPKQEFVMPKISLDMSLIIALATIAILSLLYVIYHSAFAYIGPIPNPLSLASTGSVLVEHRTKSTPLETLDLNIQQFHKLQETGVAEGYPLLDTLKQLERSTMDYGRILRGVEKAINRTVATNDLFKQIDIGGIIASREGKKITLENVKITLTDGEKEQTPVVLAAAFVENLERSQYFKDVESSSLTSKTTVTQGETSQTFTPLTISMTYQAPLEPNDADEIISLEDELQSLLDPFSQENNG